MDNNSARIWLVRVLTSCELRTDSVYFEQDALNSHYLRPGVSNQEHERFNIVGSRMMEVFNYTINLALLLISRFATAHSYTIQKLHEVRHN